MNKIYSTLLIVAFIINSQVLSAASSLNLNGVITSGLNGTGNTVYIPNPNPPPPTVIAYALNDEVGVDTTKTLQATGNVAANDVVTIDGARQPISVSLLWNTPAASPYGFLNFNSNGQFTYTLYDKSLDILKLQPGKTLEDVFEYTIQGYPDAKAVIRVHIAGNPTQIVARNDEISADTQTKLKVEGNVTTNDDFGANGVNSVSLSLLTPASSQYGFLSLDSSGKFIYTVYDKAPAVLAINAGETVDDVFTYQVVGQNGINGATATLTVHISGNPNQIILRNDEISADTQITLKVEGDVSANDDLGANGVKGVSMSLNTPASSQYGFLQFDSAGKFTYTVYDKADAVLAIQAGQTVDDVFTYNATTPNNAYSATATLTVHISGNPLKIIAVNDEAGVDPVDGKTVSGDVLANDLNVLKGSAALVGSSSSQYGHLAFDSSGKFTYTVFSNIELLPGEVKTDVFTYSVRGPNGNGSATATLTIRIAGNVNANANVQAIDDTATLVIDSSSVNPSVTVNLLDNDINPGGASLIGSPIGKFGFIDGALSKSGDLKYRVDMNNAEVQKILKSNTPLMETFTYQINGKDPYQTLTSQGKVNIYIVTGNVVPFKAFDFVDTIVAEEAAAASTGTGATTGTTTNASATPGTVKGNLITYNNGLLNIQDLTTHAEILTSQFGTYGYLKFTSGTSEFEYQLNNNVPEVQALRNTSAPLQDIFKYRITDRYGTTAEANIVINIVSRREQVTTDNVEIENNNSSSFATPLNSGAYMRGNLMNGSDRDWFYITSNGNEIVHLELCPQGFNCYNQKAWVLYVFDGDQLTQAMQDKTYPMYRRWSDSTFDKLYDENHMYLLYNSGVFDNALVGVIDPCYGNKSVVDVGIPTLQPGKTRNYFVAISSPLARDGGSTSSNGGTSSATCSSGSVVLEKTGPSKDVTIAPSTTTVVTGSTSTVTTATTKTITSTDDYISVYPNSDDQYTLKVTRTGASPVNTRSSTDAASYNASTGNVTVPKMRVDDTVLSATLKQTVTPGLAPRSANDVPKFTIMDFQILSEALSANPYLGTFNHRNNVVKLPKVTVEQTGDSYSVDLLFKSNRTLELLSVTPLK